MNISVIIPVYNKKDTIIECLSSVLNQTIGAFEVIIVNDGSTDNSNALIEEIISNYPTNNIIHIEQVNGGVSAARNKGIEVAQGSHLCFLDADDIWDNNFIFRLKNLIKDYPLADMYSLHHRIRQGSKVLSVKAGVELGFTGYLDNFFQASCRGSIVKSSKVCIRREVFSDKENLFPEGVVAGEDLYVWIKVALQGRVAFDNSVSCTVIQDEDDSRQARADSVPYPLVYFSKKENNKNLSDSCKDYIALIGFKHFISDIINKNYLNAIRRWRYLFRFSPLRALIPFYLRYVILK